MIKVKLVTYEFCQKYVELPSPLPLFVLTEIKGKPAAFVRGAVDHDPVYIQHNNYLYETYRLHRARGVEESGKSSATVRISP